MCAGLVEALREDGEGVVQLAGGSGPGRALSGEHEDGSGGLARDAAATTAVDSVPSASVASALRSSSRSRPWTTARWSRWERLDVSDQPMSATSRSSSAAAKARSFAAWPARALRPCREDPGHQLAFHGRDFTHVVRVRFGLGGLFQDEVGVRAAGSKLEMPARRGRSGASGHSLASVSSRTAPDDQSTCVDGRSTCSVFGSTPCRIAMIILMMPPTPAAACV